MELSGPFGYSSDVFSLNPTFVEIEIPASRDLLDRALAGDVDAFGEICRVYEARLLRQAITLCGDASLAEDLAQDTLVEAWKCLRRYNGRCRFFTWLCAILLNRYRNAIRQKRPLPVGIEAATILALPLVAVPFALRKVEILPITGRLVRFHARAADF